jgi:hypothetical protein
MEQGPLDWEAAEKGENRRVLKKSIEEAEMLRTCGLRNPHKKQCNGSAHYFEGTEKGRRQPFPVPSKIDLFQLTFLNGNGY